MDSSWDHLFKVLLIGDAGTGKSCLLRSFSGEAFQDSYLPTIGVNFSVGQREIDGLQVVKLQVWDTAGQQRFRAITASYYRGAHGILINYAVTDRESFEHVSEWMEEVKNNGWRDVKLVLVGNKCDLSSERQVSCEEGQRLAANLNIPFIEVSAKECVNVEEAMLLVADAMLDGCAAASQVVSLSGDWHGNVAQITCLSLAGNELATVAVEDPGATNWAVLRRDVVRAVAAGKVRLGFVLCDGSLLTVADGNKCILDLFELRQRDEADSAAPHAGGDRVIGVDQLATVLQDAVSQQDGHLDSEHIAMLQKEFLHTTGSTSAPQAVRVTDFLRWLLSERGAI